MSFFYKGEIWNILISIVTISLAFSMFSGYSTFLVVLLTVGLGFFLHEMGHKFTAIRYGAVAVYKIWTWGLVMALFLAAATMGRFVFAAPGAVYIWKENLTKKEDAVISLAGPAMNALLAGLFFLFMISPGLNSLWKSVAFFGFYVNVFLGLFNMTPIYPLDGSKVWAYSPALWSLFTIPLGIVFLLML